MSLRASEVETLLSELDDTKDRAARIHDADVRDAVQSVRVVLKGVIQHLGRWPEGLNARFLWRVAPPPSAGFSFEKAQADAAEWKLTMFAFNDGIYSVSDGVRLFDLKDLYAADRE